MKRNISYHLGMIMRIIFALLLAAGVLLGSVFNFGHRSYAYAFVISALLAALVICRGSGFSALLKRLFEKIEQTGKRKMALILSIFCFVVNLVCVLHYEIIPRVDFGTFYDQAVAVANRRPLMHMYLALFPHVFGYAWTIGQLMTVIGESVRAITVLNVCLTTITGVLIFSLCDHWFDLPTAAASFFLWSICPSKMLYNCMVLSEPLYTCTLMVFFLLVVLEEKHIERSMGGLTGFLVSALLGAAAAAALLLTNMLRPIAAVMLIAFFIWLFMLRGEKARSLHKWKRWLVFSGVMLITYTLSWNYWVSYETWRLQERPADLPAYSIYVGLDPVSEGSFSDVDMDMLMNYRYDAENGSAVWAQEQMMENVKELLSSGQVRPLNLLLKKLPKFFGNDEGGAFYASPDISVTAFRIWSAVSNVFYYTCVIFCLIGTRHRIDDDEAASPLLLPLFATGLTLAHMIVEVAGRYKYCLIPVLIMLTAKELSETFLQKTQRGDTQGSDLL